MRKNDVAGTPASGPLVRAISGTKVAVGGGAVTVGGSDVWVGGAAVTVGGGAVLVAGSVGTAAGDAQALRTRATNASRATGAMNHCFVLDIFHKPSRRRLDILVNMKQI